MTASRWIPVLSSLIACVGRIEQPDSSNSEAPSTASGQPASSVVEPAFPQMPSSGVEYQEVGVPVTLDLASTGLCYIVESYDAGAGLYRVERIVVSEDVYVQLELIAPWSSMAPERPVVSLKTNNFPVRVGEELGVLMAGPSSDSNGANRLFALGTFHDLGSGYTNGQLFRLNPISAEELGVVVRAAVAKAGSPDCPDIRPERPPLPEPYDGPDQVPGPEVEGIPG